MKVALLTNFIPPYRKELYLKFSLKVEELKVFISTNMESSRGWAVDHGELNVETQKNLSLLKTWGDNYQSQIHIPYNTFFDLQRFKPDVVISSELGFRTLMSAIFCVLFRKPLIIWLALSEHTERDKKGARMFLRKFLFKNASAIFCNGESAKKYVYSLGIKPPSYFIPCTTDYNLGSPKMRSIKNEISLFYSGQLIPRKGIKELCEALKLWLETHSDYCLNLIVAGDGEEIKYLQQIQEISNLKLQLLGQLQYGELRSFYEQVDFYLFPTLGDEWGVVVNEAFACGTPVIGSIYSQAVLELVKDFETGWQYDPLNSQSLIEVLNRAIEITEAEYEEMSKNCIQSVSEITAEIISEVMVLAVKEAKT